MSRPETELANHALLSQYIATLQNQLKVQKKENQQLHNYFQESLTFMEQNNNALSRAKQENYNLKSAIGVLDRRLIELSAIKQRLQGLLVNEKDLVANLSLLNKALQQQMREQQIKIKDLTKQLSNTSIKEYIVKPVDKQQPQYEKVAQGQTEYKMALLKEEFAIKEVCLQNTISKLQKQNRELIKKLASQGQCIPIEIKEMLGSMFQQNYKSLLLRAQETIAHQAQQLHFKQKEIQALENSNSLLRKLKLGSTELKEESFSISAIQDLSHWRHEKFRSGKTLASHNSNSRKQRKSLKKMLPLELTINVFEQASVPTSAEHRSCYFINE